MFTQSWSNFILVILSLSTAYYLFRCHMEKNCRRSMPGSANRDQDHYQNREPLFRDKNEESFDHADENRLDKKVVMSALHLLIDKYPGIKDPLLQKSVEDFIIRESTSSIHLNDEELSELWS